MASPAPAPPRWAAPRAPAPAARSADRTAPRKRPDMTGTSGALELQAGGVPRRFTIYAAAVVAAAAVALIAFGSLAGVGGGFGTATFWLLAAFVLVGELLPVPVPRRHGLER